MLSDAYDRRPLDELGILEGTDKSSLCHAYLEHYARAFEPFRSLSINIIEIGVQNGASARMWRDYFPYAQIIGVDIQESCQDMASDRLVIEIGSQADDAFLGDLVKRYPPTIIIDDGSHLAAHQIFSFENLFLSLVPGGCYVVEDLHIHAPDAQKQASLSGVPWPPDYFAGFARHLMDGFVAKDLQTHHRGELLHATKRVDSFHGSVMLWRHEDHRLLKPHDLRWLQATVAASDLHYGWAHLANYLDRISPGSVHVLAAAERAAVLMPDHWPYFERLLRAATACEDNTLKRMVLNRAVLFVREPARSRFIEGVDVIMRF